MKIIAIIILLIASNGFAQHLRIYACAIANDSAGASLANSSNGSGLYQSDDTGKTWKHLGWNNIKCYSMDEVQSSNGKILYEATGLGILRSSDYGKHWKQITDWRISEAMDVAVNQKNPNEIYIATAHGPWRSEDGGGSWDLILTGLHKILDDEIVPYSSKIVFDSAGMKHVFLGSENGVFAFDSNNVWKAIQVNSNKRMGVDFQALKITDLVQESTNAWVACSEKGFLLNSYDSGKTFNEFGMPQPLWCYSNLYGIGFHGKLRYSWDDRIAGGKKGVQFAHRDEDVGGGFGTEIDTCVSNVSACLDIGAITILGTLGDGIFTRNPTEYLQKPYNRDYDYSREGRIGKQTLSYLQIWTLKSFLVAP